VVGQITDVLNWGTPVTEVSALIRLFLSGLVNLLVDLISRVVVGIMNGSDAEMVQVSTSTLIEELVRSLF